MSSHKQSQAFVITQSSGSSWSRISAKLFKIGRTKTWDQAYVNLTSSSLSICQGANPQVIFLFISSYQSAHPPIFEQPLSSQALGIQVTISLPPPIPFLFLLPHDHHYPIKAHPRLPQATPPSLQQFIFLTSYLLLKHGMSKLLIHHLIFLTASFSYVPVTTSPIDGISKPLLYSILPLLHFLLMSSLIIFPTPN